MCARHTGHTAVAIAQGNPVATAVAVVPVQGVPSLEAQGGQRVATATAMPIMMP